MLIQFLLKLSYLKYYINFEMEKFGTKSTKFCCIEGQYIPRVICRFKYFCKQIKIIKKLGDICRGIQLALFFLN